MTQEAGEDRETASRPHYAGHRDRLRQRFLNGGIDALADYELLELLLFAGIPRRDVKPLAKSLLTRFGSLAGVLNAEAPELRNAGLGEAAVVLVRIVKASSMHMIRHEVMNRPILNSWSRLLEYCHAAMAHEKTESFRILFLNKKNELIADEVQQKGTVDHTPAYPREIMRRALEIGATAIILVHNHPSGDPSPSKDDIDMTHAIIAAARPLNIIVHDHLIIARNGSCSLRNAGHM